MRFWRQLKIWTTDHWIAVVSTLFVSICLVLTIYGMRQLESFYRTMTLATLPLQILTWIFGSIISAFVYVALMFGMFSKQNRKKIKSDHIGIRFDDVIGVDEAKEEAREVVQLLKDRARLKNVGGKILRGVLMQGPPGCGKTFLAKAIATEADIPFMSLAASDFVEIFVGVGASRVRKLFQEARRQAYAKGACIIFIDELDAIGRSRSFSWMGGQETNSTLNSLLVEMDGLQNEQASVVVIGATNADEGHLDAALMRPGRFDRKIYVDRPNLKGREQVFAYYMKKIQYDTAVDVPRLARRAVGKTPAEIENIVKEAALIATRQGRDKVIFSDLSEAFERVDLGIKHRRSMTDTERKMTAYHETGHLMATYFLHPTDDVFKASIIGRRGSLGVVWHVPREELHSHTKAHLLSNIKVALAGYAAERMVFHTSTSGVASDFQQAMAIAHNMVWRLGMGKKYIGDWEMVANSGSGSLHISEAARTELNEEANKILQECLKEVEDLLTKERALMDKFVTELIRKEELEYDEIEAIFRDAGKSRGLSPAF
jgi:cell division protease FtsH